MFDNVKIRIANSNDAKSISTLINGVAHYFTLHPKGVGAEAFLATVSESAIRSYICASNFHYLAGFADGNLAGVVAIRDNKHLYHLFVSPPYQGRGFARALWNAAMTLAMRQGNPGEFTVNSTPYAVKVYASFGFEPAGQKVETKGIAFVPMNYRRGALLSELNDKEL
jgi:GNAT superfamily N-acetyltransferase